MLKNFFFLIFSAFFSTAFSQTAGNYPKNYFANPLDIPIQLSGNFGELRNNHFHMGLDIRTDRKENLNVYAAAEGYVSKIKVERYGFGQAVYITHPNGYVTVYAHLNKFYDTLQKFVKAKQYADKVWEQEIEFSPEQFPVKKRQFIALSGNTGGSQGPHLHFEIRDAATDVNINPLFFYNIKDNIKPVLTGFYMYDGNKSMYHQTAERIAIKASGGNYTATKPVIKTGNQKLSFGFTGEDKITGSPFKFGIYKAVLLLDNEEQFSFATDSFDYRDSRYINGCIDYTKRIKGGPYVQYVSKLPNSRINIFNTSVSNGIIELTDTLVHEITIKVYDAANNVSVIKSKIQYDETLAENMMGIQNYYPFKAGSENRIDDEKFAVLFNDTAFYDNVNFVHSSATGEVGEVHNLHNYTVPVQNEYSVKIKAEKNLDKKDKILMQLVSGSKYYAIKPEWSGDVAEGKFKNLGKVSLFVDETEPYVIAINFSNGGTVAGNTLILKATDNSDEINSFNAYLDGEWLLFKRKDDLFIYDVDERCPNGKHELKITVEDIAGNIAEKTYTFTKANKKPAVKKSAKKPKRKS